jgi:hypothetical protein
LPCVSTLASAYGVGAAALLLPPETAEKVRCTAESETPSRCKRI